MYSALPISWILLVGFVLTDGLVHQFSAQRRQVPIKELARRDGRRHAMWEKRNIHDFDHPQAISPHFHRSMRQRRSLGVLNAITPKYFDEHYVNISVGTPPQTLEVRVDFMYVSDFALMDSDAPYPEYWDGTKRYNRSASSTYSTQGSNFTVMSDRGYFGSDIVEFGGIKTNLSIAILQESVKYENEGGVMGLSFHNSEYSPTTTFLSQIAPYLDQPVITLRSNYSQSIHTVFDLITLGSLDKANCQEKWFFTKRLKRVWNYAVNATSVAVADTNGKETLNLTAPITVSIDDGVYLYMTTNIHQLLVNATDAVYNDTADAYFTHCNTSAMGKIVLNMGNGKLVLNPEVYVAKYQHNPNICYLNAHFGDSKDNYILLGQHFLASHCMAYNFKSDEIGFAPSLKTQGVWDTGLEPRKDSI